MKYLLSIFLFLPVIVFAQPKKLIVEGSAPNYYINHTTGAKENFYSIGRIYNISPRIFAPYNQLELEKGLSIGQVVRIPLNDINFSENGSATEDELILPLYNKSLGKEKLIGYLKVKKELSSLAANAISPKKIIHPETETVVLANVPKTEAPVKKVETSVVTSNEVKTVKPVSEPTQTANNNVTKAPTPEPEPTPGFKGGFFSSAFTTQIIKTNYIPATGSIFKSTSGWKDEKYYCFHNIADAGSIVKLTNPSNGKSIYAKVLDVIPDIPKNQGINILISNSAADELGVSGDTFGCKLSY